MQVFGISGQITQGTNGPPLGGINVAVSGPMATNVTTGLMESTWQADSAGHVPGHADRPGLLPLQSAARSVTLGLTNASTADFVALRDAYSISGRFTNGAAGVSGIAVSAGGTNVTVTDPHRLLRLFQPLLGALHYHALDELLSVRPCFFAGRGGPGNAAGLDFSATPDVHTISGRITDSGVGVSNITVQAGNRTTNTDSSGNYVFSGLCPGNYTVTPSEACRLFNPATPRDAGADAGGVNFVTFSDNLSRIRGQITDGVNGLSNVLVTARGGGLRP